MLRKILIGALVLALTPALAFAAPMTMKHEMTVKPAVTHTLKLHKRMHRTKKEKIRLIQKRHALKTHRALEHRI
jgi:hypothetical protein